MPKKWMYGIETAFIVVLFILGAGPGRSVSTPRTESSQPVNVIFFLGDGMSFPVITAARLSKPVSNRQLTLDSFPYTAVVRTHSLDRLVTDSAAGMTAPMTGYKTRNGMLAVVPTPNAKSWQDVKEVKTVLEYAEEAGYPTGIVTTDRITQATPGACYAHVASRGQVADITKFLVHPRFGDGIEVILSGGWYHLLPKTENDPEGHPGGREDGENIIAQLVAQGYQYVWKDADFQKVNPTRQQRLLGVFETDHMAWESRRAQDELGEPSLTEMTEKAIRVLQAFSLARGKPYFLVVEGAQIDKAQHENWGYGAITEMLAFDAAIKRALEIVDISKTLIVVTADHSHTLSINSDAPYESNVLGLAKDRRGRPARDSYGNFRTLITFANGPGYRQDPAMLTEELATREDYRQKSVFPLPSSTHGGEDVVLAAHGPGAERVRGFLDNTALFTIMLDALDLRANKP